jgi:hypothetical protein
MVTMDAVQYMYLFTKIYLGCRGFGVFFVINLPWLPGSLLVPCCKFTFVAFGLDVYFVINS